MSISAYLGGAKLHQVQASSRSSENSWTLSRPTQLRLLPPRNRIVSLQCMSGGKGSAAVQQKPKPLNTKRMGAIKRNLDQLMLKLEPVRVFISRQWTKAAVGILLGVAALAVHANFAPKIIPYSTLVQLLEERLIQKVAFEEDSAAVFFNVIPGAKEVQPEVADKEGEGDEPALIDVKRRLLEDLSPKQPESATRAAFVMAQLAKGLQLVRDKLPPPEYEFRSRRIAIDEQNLMNLVKYKSTDVEYMSIVTWASLARAAARGAINFSIPLSALISLMHLGVHTNIFKKKPSKKTSQSIKFDDVAGVDTARTELEEVVACVKGMSNFKSLGANLPKGVLLVGPPGTGKTLLARAVAGEAGIPFFAISASEFVEVFVGRGAARVRELFREARKHAPAIVFIDEIDAVGGKRGRAYNDEKDQTLNQLLTELDGFNADQGVLVIGATNRLDALDPALCRPGRFSRKVMVREPDFEGRKQVLAVHMRNVPVESDDAAEVIRNQVAGMTPGFVGADLANVVNEAALLAARNKDQQVVTIENFKDAVNRVKYPIDVADKGTEGPKEGDVPFAITQ